MKAISIGTIFSIYSVGALATDIDITTQRGKPVVIGIHPSLKDDCTRGPFVDVRLGKQPSSGTVILQRGVISLGKDAPCPYTEASAQRLVFKPKMSFIGLETIEYETVDYQSRVKKHKRIITVIESKIIPDPDQRPVKTVPF